jgi:hypothetical protein
LNYRGSFPPQQRPLRTQTPENYKIILASYNGLGIAYCCLSRMG